MVVEIDQSGYNIDLLLFSVSHIQQSYFHYVHDPYSLSQWLRHCKTQHTARNSIVSSDETKQTTVPYHKVNERQ